MDTGAFGIPISMLQMNGCLFNHSVHLSSARRSLDPYLTPTATPTGRVNLPMLTIGPALARRWEQGVRFSFWHRISPPKSAFGSDPTGIRTRVFAVRGRCPWPLDDGALPTGRGRFYPTVSASSKGFEVAL